MKEPASHAQRPTAVALSPSPESRDSVRNVATDLGFNTVCAERGDEPLYLALFNETIDLLVIDGEATTIVEVLRLHAISSIIPKLVVLVQPGAPCPVLDENVVWEVFPHVATVDKPCTESALRAVVAAAFPSASSIGLKLEPLENEPLNSTYDVEDAAIIDVMHHVVDTMVSVTMDPTDIPTDLEELEEASQPPGEFSEGVFGREVTPMMDTVESQTPAPILIHDARAQTAPPKAASGTLEVSPFARRLAARIRGLSLGDPDANSELEEICERAVRDEWIFSGEGVQAQSTGEPVLRGRLEALPVEAILRRAEELPGSNLCVFDNGDAQVEIFFDEHCIVAARHHGRSGSWRLGRFLVDAEVVDRDVVSDIVETLSPHQLLGEALLQKELVGQNDLLIALTRQVEELTDHVLGWEEGSFVLEIGASSPPHASVEVSPRAVIERRYHRLIDSFSPPARRIVDEPTRRFQPAKLDN